MTLGPRASGVLLHPTSLPGPWGHGDLGPAAARFCDFLAASGQTWWQMLPIEPPGPGGSPYSSWSSRAGNPWLVAPESLVAWGLVRASELPAPPHRGAGPADFAAGRRLREPLFRVAFERAWRSPELRARLRAFRQANRDWLGDHALFAALRRAHGRRPWTEWSDDLRAPTAEVRYQEFLQWLFARAWRDLRAHARRRGVRLLGDVPLYVAHDGVDVWANPELFRLDRRGRPEAVSGAPPDGFNPAGQLWGSPLYRWDLLRARGYEWWVARLGAALARFHAVRLDHFIGFRRFWEVPVRARSARRGRWRPGPGEDFFLRVLARLGRARLVAEDLGAAGPDVEELRDAFGLPGMRVVQFAVDDELPPDRWPRNSVGYTSTHDTDTAAGWWRGLGRGRARARRRLGLAGREIHWEAIELVWGSAADTAIAPAQDLLGLGSEARLNRPGTTAGNWRWRLAEGDLDDAVARRLAGVTAATRRDRRADP